MKFIGEKSIYDNVEYIDLIRKMKEALMKLSMGDVDVPLRTHIESTKLNSTYLFMPSFCLSENTVAYKYVAVCNNNPNRGLPAINGIVMTADAQTGIVDAIIDAAGLTAVRTGCIGGAATDVLSTDDSEVLSIFGSSTQAYTQILAACSIRKIKRINIFYKLKDQAETLAEKVNSNIHAEIKLTENMSDLNDSDIIVTVTNSKKPVFKFDEVDLKPSVHINAIGSFKQNMQEIDEKIYSLFEVFVDHKETCLAETGDLLIPLKKGLLKEENITELGKCLPDEEHCNKLKGRKTIFKSVGNAAFDLFAAKYLKEVC